MILLAMLTALLASGSAVVAVLLLYATSLIMLSMAISTLVAVFLLVHWVMLLLAVFPYLGALREIGS